MALVELDRVTKVYRRGAERIIALREVSLSVEKGDFVAIVGPSGSGKSTLVNLLGCLDSPTEGRVLFEGRDVSGLSDDELASLRNKKIGFVFQRFHLVSRFSALENVILPLYYSDEMEVDLRERGKMALKEVNLLSRISHKPLELSGGEAQRVAIARALVNEPELVLADEPTGNLDKDTGMEIVNLFLRLNQTKGTGFILVTHNLEIARLAQKIVRLESGRIVGSEEN